MYMSWEGEKRCDRGPTDNIRKTPCQAAPITYRQLPVTALDETCAFQLPGRICDGRPLDAQHLCKNILGDRQLVSITAVAHHKEPTR
jgi:hypothetical protein